MYVIFGLLTGLLAWIGNRLHNKLDELGQQVNAQLEKVNDSLRGIEKELRNDLVDLEIRVTVLEQKNDKCSNLTNN